MYCAKRFAYIPPVYRIGNELAALDNNIHSDRGVMRNKEGEIVYHRCYNKKSGRWTIYPCKEKKTSSHQGSYSKSHHLST
ncbi:hypothetical protein ACJMK2_020553 [Sinanodonta woodiana]|uniref:Uncharacterized protein n=1 Tax=Sinanodonta woodiana TaxID=1069815 RepID=A0ABD3U2C4_SINWO